MIFMTSIVGTKFRGPSAMATVAALPCGFFLRLRREPDNEFDPNAIAVYCGTAHLGYVPRTHNIELAPVLDRNGGEAKAEVVAEAILDKGDVRFAPKLEVRFPGVPGQAARNLT